MQDQLRSATTTSRGVQVGNSTHHESISHCGRGQSPASSPPTSDPDLDDSIQTSPLARFSTTAAASRLPSQRTAAPTPLRRGLLPEQLNSESEDDVGGNIVVVPGRQTPVPAVSPASTQVVEETPQFAQQRHREAIMNNPTRAHRRAPETAGPEEDSGSIHYATDPDPAIEIAKLRKSRNVLAQSLEESTAQLNRFRASQVVRGQSKSAETEELQRAGLDPSRAMAALGTADNWRGRITAIFLGFLMGVMVLFLLWVWANGPDYEYIRKRRADVLYE
ncbi:hypothetical protein CB0940_08034 [Cercospora beticola]|uniref:Uncharacterized protein n=1 Tax=Cercospora beticola TaxID=122368 RepID=A0A2G5HQH2_CERBT|nr:hypothetical protein CB0940_08034 [Cercospora beticola]PIA94784.1 hypothetical protein CB0940_08034 [Cercospora beticola]WPB04590.1 hypothetical protein RHO25_009236 [Cercospora beticola]